MTEDDKTKLINEKRESYRRSGGDDDSLNFSWSAVSKPKTDIPKKVEDTGRTRTFNSGLDNFLSSRIDFVGKNLEAGKFSKENLANANFSVVNLVGVDFSGANLKNADFSGSNLTGANLSGANLEGAVFSGAQLVGTNFSGANLRSVILMDADIQDAILLDIEIDEIGLEELQTLVEYLAKYYPHKLNLARINLTMLNLSQIDLTKVSLRGVDFTGCDFTGVNIFDLDLSECIITPEQIAQALGKVPNKEEMAKLLAPKKKKTKGSDGIDFNDFFLGSKEIGVMDFTKDKGIGIDKILAAGKKVFRNSKDMPPIKDKDIIEKIKEEQKIETKSHNEELRSVIEERKRQFREGDVEPKKPEVQETVVARDTSGGKDESAEKKDIKRDMIDRLKMERGGRE